MKNYTANEELAQILLSNGLIETSDEYEKRHDKRRFKPNRSSTKHVYFDNINIYVRNRSNQSESMTVLKEEDLKAILFYFKVKLPEFRLVLPDGKFTFTAFKKGIVSAEKTCKLYSELPRAKKDFEKMSKVLSIYNSIAV